MLVGVADRRALPGLELDGQDLLLEAALCDSGDRAAVALDGEGVLVLPRDLPLGRYVLGRDAHMAVVERVRQSTDHGVDHLGIVQTLTLAHPRQPVLGPAHALGP